MLLLLFKSFGLRLKNISKKLSQELMKSVIRSDPHHNRVSLRQLSHDRSYYLAEFFFSSRVLGKIFLMVNFLPNTTNRRTLSLNNY